MDENNNNQVPINDENEKMTIEPVKNLDPKLFATVVLLILVAVTVVILMLNKTSHNGLMVTDETVLTPTGQDTENTTPKKVSAGKTLPENFPKELILGENTVITEGYSLDYDELVQRTAEYSLSSSTVEIFNEYLLLLKEQNWVIMNKHETEEITSIYAMRKNEELNLTIRKDDNSEIQSSLISVSLISK